ncbi:MAG TPA: DUF2914 domain-containing protein [Candidatus Paceibacterota bacterium]|nr:DUF2914 domain-containing protein [Candidatus Paceibacterota bacterium]HMP18884.1 DUF2914 domain-containing protein [Candidatus Paceibacterota bacterium]HMP85045.1 DUF2914 domain-containing protein [Candidatus Paceibacterota bacterium]
MKNILNYFKKNEKYIGPIFMFGGFFIDSLTLRRSDLLAENLLLLFYLLLAGIIIMVINKYQQSRYVSIFNFLLFFTFGGLFSVFTVFYVRSSAISASWPFLILLFGAMISTEFLRKQYQIFNIQISVYFLAIFSFLIFHLPIVTGIMNFWIFMISGLVALTIIYFYLFIIKKFINKNILFLKNIVTISMLFLIVNFMYFLNFIPPVPLVMMDAEIGINVVKENNIYKITDYKNDSVKLLGLINWKEKISLLPNQRIYFFNSVFAPSKIKTEIYHVWQKYDTKTNKWQNVAKIPINLQGGRDYGYRSYSYVSNYSSGKWRVVIETGKGQVVGIHNFNVEVINNIYLLEDVIFKYK